jgi:putative transcriptional regulator
MQRPTHLQRLVCGLSLALVAVGAVASPPGATPAADSKLAPGKLLVAAEDMRDPNFADTVVLLIDYSETGAVGLVINDLLEVPVSEVFPDIEEMAELPDLAHYGGPVAMNRAVVLLRSAGEPEGGDHVFGEVWVAGSRESLLHAVRSEDESFSVYLGHAGWAPGQLDAEVAQDGWHILPAEESLIFDRDPEEVYPELLRRSRTVLVHDRTPGIETVAPSNAR